MQRARLEIEIALALLPAASLKFVAWLYLELTNKTLLFGPLCKHYYAWLYRNDLVEHEYKL